MSLSADALLQSYKCHGLMRPMRKAHLAPNNVYLRHGIKSSTFQEHNREKWPEELLMLPMENMSSMT